MKCVGPKAKGADLWMNWQKRERGWMDGFWCRQEQARSSRKEKKCMQPRSVQQVFLFGRGMEEESLWLSTATWEQLLVQKKERLSESRNEGRIAQAWVNVRGGMRVFSVSFWHSEGWTPRNEALMEAVMNFDGGSYEASENHQTPVVDRL